MGLAVQLELDAGGRERGADRCCCQNEGRSAEHARACADGSLPRSPARPMPTGTSMVEPMPVIAVARPRVRSGGWLAGRYPAGCCRSLSPAPASSAAGRMSQIGAVRYRSTRASARVALLIVSAASTGRFGAQW